MGIVSPELAHRYERELVGSTLINEYGDTIVKAKHLKDNTFLVIAVRPVKTNPYQVSKVIYISEDFLNPYNETGAETLEEAEIIFNERIESGKILNS
jgi:hypothetical protein